MDVSFVLFFPNNGHILKNKILDLLFWLKNWPDSVLLAEKRVAIASIFVVYSRGSKLIFGLF